MESVLSHRITTAAEVMGEDCTGKYSWVHHTPLVAVATEEATVLTQLASITTTPALQLP
jgi:hypothetical protein